MGKGEPQPAGFLGSLDVDQEKALDGLKVALVELHFPESGLEEEHLSIWGVPLHSLGTGEMSISQKVVLLKFLRSRDFDVERAALKLMRALQWRKAYGVSNVINESFPKELEAHCYSHGTDKSGRPVQYNVYSNIDPTKLLSNEENIQKFIRWRVKLMEQTVSEQLDFENGIEDIVHVHDYSGVQLLRMDAKFKAVMLRIIRVFGDYYPEMLSTKYFINVPKVAELLFNVASMFVNKKTVSKFQICGQSKIRGTLLERISPNQLPPAYGGFLSTLEGWCNVQSTTIPARSKAEFVFQLDSSQELRWEYLTENQDISVSVSSQGSRDAVGWGRQEYGVGRYKNLCKGSVLLTFDNSYSFFTDKTVWFRTGVFSS